jgi:Whirly transcription factor
VVLFILGRSSKVFVGYSIYKGKAALTVTPKAPEFSLLDVASLSLGFSISFFSLCFYFSPLLLFIRYIWFFLLQSGVYKVSKEGFVFLQFAPGLGNRQFDWTRKQVSVH